VTSLAEAVDRVHSILPVARPIVGSWIKAS